MHEVDQALKEVQDLYKEVLGTPAPQVDPSSYLAFPPGVDPLRHTVEEIDQLKRLSRQWAMQIAPVAWVPRADLYSAKDGLLIRLEIPGVDRERLKVTVQGGECVVRGERKTPTGQTGLHPMNLELPFGPFERRFRLPEGSRAEGMQARYTDGVLELRLGIDDARTAATETVEVH